MSDSPRHSTSDEGLTVAPALDLVLDSARVPRPVALIDDRVLRICGLSLLLGVGAAVAAELLVGLINLATNLSFFGRWSLAPASPADNQLGLKVIAVPLVGSLIVGFLARYGSKAIRGHGIPEAMEQVLTNQSRISPRLIWLKPLSAAISIGTGGPFGAEGPIISTAGAIGSVLGQFLQITAHERKTLLAAGAAAGMAATFGSPVSAVLLAIELLLFEYRPRSVIPVALAAAVAAGIRDQFDGAAPAFAMPALPAPSLAALLCYIVLGGIVGVAAVLITRLVYAIEDLFERLPIHWMWWPAAGALAVGIVGYFAPRTLGVGYDNISDVLSGKLLLSAAVFLGVMKLISWSISLGSGTSGGTLAPLFTIGGCLGAACGSAADRLAPALGVDPRVAALVGMAALFAGASRALLTSIVFALETTLQPLGLLPLLAGCSASYLVSLRLMRHSIMTEKIARRGIVAPGEYQADLLEQILVRDAATRTVVTVPAGQTVAATRLWLEGGAGGTTHQAFPLVDEAGHLVAIVTRRDLIEFRSDDARPLRQAVTRLPRYVYEDCSLRQAAGHMVAHDIGRLPVVARENPQRLTGILTRSDILSAYRRLLAEHEPAAANLKLPLRFRKPDAAVSQA